MSAPNSQKAKLIARLQTYVPLYDWPLLDELAESGGPEGDGWNAGIEAAAKLVDEKHDPCEPWLTGDEVRALKRPEAGADDGWISVKDRLPTKENEDCLLATDRFVVGNLPWKLDQHGNGAGWLDLFEGALWTTNEIAFWMPIPSLPNATLERQG